MMPAQRPLRASLQVMWLLYLYQEIAEIAAKSNDEPSFKSLSMTVMAVCEGLASVVFSILCCKSGPKPKAWLLSRGVVSD